MDHLKAPPGTSIDLCDWSTFCALEFRMNIEAVFFTRCVWRTLRGDRNQPLRFTGMFPGRACPPSRRRHGPSDSGST